ncbi:pectin esterase [Niallia circulans]|uniref:Pectinesterase n=1 Tax=Niallia circulans TaxID=1397 RepID=A0A553STM5_NIACI|nr:pectinesterase family protein [Niallia circulans]TRZ40350.1 pectin esterase [Niallia circulans]
MEKVLRKTSLKSLVVGRNEMCDFSSIQAALDYWQEERGPLKLTILSGKYHENILLYQSDISIIGVGTVQIIGNRYALQKNEQQQEIGTFQTATFFINGSNIAIENIEIINNAGPGETVGQAVALYNEGTNITFKNCSFKGYQDTICLGPLPALQKNGQLFSTPKLKTSFKEHSCHFSYCYIEGTVDFIFGGGEAVFQGCEIKSLKRPNNDEGYITAASTPEGENGLYFIHCYLTADKDVTNVYLGRPWRSFAKTTFANCRIGKHVHPVRWDDWENQHNRKTATYKEYKNIYHSKKELVMLDWITFIE